MKNYFLVKTWLSGECSWFPSNNILLLVTVCLKHAWKLNELNCCCGKTFLQAHHSSLGISCVVPLTVHSMMLRTYDPEIICSMQIKETLIKKVSQLTTVWWVSELGLSERVNSFSCLLVIARAVMCKDGIYVLMRRRDWSGDTRWWWYRPGTPGTWPPLDTGMITTTVTAPLSVIVNNCQQQ